MFKYILRGAIALIMLVAAFELYDLMYMNDEIRADPAKVDSFMLTVEPITTSDMILRIENPNDKPTFVYINASWCPYCRKIMPRVMKLSEANKQAFNQLFISIDQDKRKLSSYLVARGYAGKFTPLQFQAQHGMPMGDALLERGGMFDGSIPYLALFDRQGRLVADSIGARDWQGLEKAMVKLAK